MKEPGILPGFFLCLQKQKKNMFEEEFDGGGLEAARRRPAVQVGARGVRLKGFNITSQIGTVTQTITQPGNMRNLIGLNLYQNVAFTNETITLTINSEKVLDNVAAKDICPETHQVSDPVIRLSRILTGNDDIKLEFTSSAAGNTANATFYFSPVPPKSVY